jgi:hypothetical protein
MTLPKDPIKKAQALMNMSLARKGKPRSIDSRRKQSKTMKESWTPERRKTFSEFRTGQKHAPATIEKMKKSALALNKHFTHSPETRKQMSISKKGIPKPESFRQVMREIKIGSHLPESTKMKISNTLKGRTVPEEQKLKIRLATKGIPKPEGFAQKERNSRWQGGISFEPYCPAFDKPFKQSTRLRQGNVCAFPGCGKTKYQNLNKDMSIHHVYTEKLACCENKIEEKDLLRKRFPPEVAKFGNQTFSPDEIKHIRMVVPLCMSHHSSVNTRKECDSPYGDTDYRKYFTELIEKKYNGKPFYTKEEMKLLRGDHH